MRDLSVYIHIPFCVRKCDYCDFLSSPASEAVQETYFRALNREIRASADQTSLPVGPCQGASDYRVVSVFFGGGTPSLPRAELICETLDTVRSRFSLAPDAEITIECNPGTLTEKKLRAYRTAGCNRLSLGLQSADNGLLRTLGRIHTRERFLEEAAAARAAGFSNLSVDIMYGLPGQTQEQWAQTLDMVLGLPGGVGHLSAYSLIIEEGTPFWARYHADAKRRAAGEEPVFLPGEEQEAQMLALLRERTRQSGLHRYEISNYAKPGRESVHNSGYWLRRPYIGFGLGAASQLGQERWKNTTDLAAYMAGQPAGTGPGAERVCLSRSEEMEETIFLGLRMTQGVDLEHFAQAFGVRAEERYAPVIEKYQDAGLLELAGSQLRLTERGFDLANVVMAEFLE